MAEVKWNPLYYGSVSTLFLPNILHTPACWFLCDNITTTEKISIEEKTKYIWNPHYAFSRIVETWLDGTFNKFLAYGVCRYINECSGDENINWWFFKWRDEGDEAVSSIDRTEISPDTFFFPERWKLKSLDSLFQHVEHKSIYRSTHAMV